jgi:hypothetical protein
MICVPDKLHPRHRHIKEGLSVFFVVGLFRPTKAFLSVMTIGVCRRRHDDTSATKMIFGYVMPVPFWSSMQPKIMAARPEARPSQLCLGTKDWDER